MTQLQFENLLEIQPVLQPTIRQIKKGFIILFRFLNHSCSYQEKYVPAVERLN
jgi:hypothetical protein